MNRTVPIFDRLSGSSPARRPGLKALAIALFLVVLACALAYGALNLSSCRTYSPLFENRLGGLIGLAGGLAFALVGFVITYARPANRIGWLCAVSGLLLIIFDPLDIYVNCALAGQITAVGVALAAWFGYVLQPPLLVTSIFVFLPLWFPFGRFLTRGWRNFGIVLLALMAISTLAIAITPSFREANSVGVLYPLDNPLGLAWLPAGWGPFWANITNLLMISGSLLAAVALFLRLKRSRREERQQLRLFAIWIAMMIFQLVVFELILWRLASRYADTAWFEPLLFFYDLILIIVFLGLPLVIGIAIFKYRLYDIDIIISHTLVYGGLSLGIIVVYILVVGGLGTLFQTQGSLLFALLATGLVAVLFQPVRSRLQHGVNRFMFGQRDDPYAVLSQLSAQLQTTDTPTDMLHSVVETIASTLKLPYVAIELADEQGELGGAVTGRAVAETMSLPLRYQKETVGSLVVSPRAPGEAFTGREKQLLADIAAQTGAMAYSVRLTATLQRSREMLVFTREEERRRIRRDLHDELGPTLASQTFAIDTILELLENNPQEAARLLRGLKLQNQKTVAEIRRLVHELRPPALDELGLVGALQAHTAQLSSRSTLEIKLMASPDPLPNLPAALEVAAYRIAREAMTNVVRHAQAQKCEVRLHVVENGRSALQIDIVDDGHGLPSTPTYGLGIRSMRERTEELGGIFTIADQARGTQVTAIIPLLLTGGSSTV